MPDVGGGTPPKERSFKLRVKDASPAVSFQIYQSIANAPRNYVKLVREGYHEAAFCLKAEDAKKICETSYPTGLECVVSDNTRNADDPFELKLWPLVPYRVKDIDRKIVLVEFRNSINNLDNAAAGYWETLEATEVPDATSFITGLEPPFSTTLETTTQYAVGTEVTSDVFETLDTSVTSDVKTACTVGFHYFLRLRTRLDLLRAYCAMCGVRYFVEPSTAKGIIVLADEDQPDLATFRPKDYVVESCDKFERKLTVPWLKHFYMRKAIDRKAFGGPGRILPDGYTAADFYAPPTKPSNAYNWPIDHYSTLIMADLLIPVTTSTIDADVAAQLATYERCVKATERTVKAYNRSSRRNDWYKLGGYHNVKLGSEIAAITYRSQTTLVDFRDYRQPLWPRIPAVNDALFTVGKMTITTKLSTNNYRGTLVSPINGAWGHNSSVIDCEDQLALYPWLEAGDECLVVMDGAKGIVIGTPVSADATLQ